MPEQNSTDPPLLELPDRASWQAWLGQRHADSSGVWLVIAKRNAPRQTPSYADALEVALCFGWIDGQKGAIDEHFWRQRFTPRGPRSRWSQINRQKATELIESGAMQPSGLAEVQRAKADGRWQAAYQPQSRATVPEDFRAALSASPEAEAFFETLTGSNRYAFLYRIQDAKRPQTRAKRIEHFIEMLAARRTLH